ncbi:choice-of-anchor P family protein [Nocardioides sp. CN2-186]|uniref:choice-of-anchor P family protein n=1 Tax=Nocardioides tweenelious TaxID=3156607 RepID=UPI0032B418C5
MSKKILLSLSAAALVGAPILIGAGPVSAGASAYGAEKPAFSGFSSSAWAAPVKIEIYEPTIPIPATPQAEFEMAYTKVEADSGSSSGRASWLWPGDSIGEGAKTVIENLGLPPELSGPLAAQGYPVQVNSSQPSGEAKMADEPFPGTVMETSASDTKTIAQTGFSPDGDVHAPQDGSHDGGGKDGGEGTPGVPGLPEIPGLPALPGQSGVSGSPTDALTAFGQAITGTSATTADDPGDDPAPTTPGAPGVPPELAALVDFEGYTSTSQNVASADKVVSSSRSALGDVQLLGGLISLDGVVVTSTSSSDGKAATAGGKASFGGITIAGQDFSFGPSGFDAAGKQTKVPALPDQATKALAQLGVKLTLPKPTLEKKGDQATSEMAGLRIQIDASKLRKKLDALPLDQLVGAVPDEAGQLKSALQAAVGLSPRIVITLGNASSTVDTVQGIAIPSDIPDNDPGHSGGGAGGGGGGAGGASTSGGAPTSATPGAGGDAPSADGDLPPSSLAGSGLPPLYSIPGAILAGGIALAAVGGTWLRKAGVLALGGAGSCSHGLDSGLPDLRKA